MDSEIIGAIITAVTTLSAALIGAWAAIYIKRMELKGKDSQDPSSENKRRVIVWGVFGALIGMAITLFVFGKISVFSSKYDNFNNPLYNESINNDLWKRMQNLNCDVKQQNGVVVFQLNEPSAENTLCYLNIPNQVKWSSVGAMEAKISTKKGASGDYSIGILEFSADGFSADTLWIAQCGMRQLVSENKIELFFNVDNSYPNSSPEIYQTIPALPDQWYKMRLEIDPDSGRVRCFVNDKILGSHQPTDANVLKSRVVNRHILGFWTPQSSATFQMDDVILVNP